MASLAIAVMALGFTIYNASLEREYKELTIRPFLHLDVETNDFHVGFINTGLGPAVIKAVATKFEPTRCLYLYNRPALPSDKPGAAMGKVFDTVLTPIDNYFADPLSELTAPPSIWDVPKSPKLYTRTLTPGEVLSPNQEVVIFQFQKEQLELAVQRLQTFTTDKYNALMRRFIARAYGLPYYVKYCSLTGSYCADQVTANCGELPPSQQAL